MTCPEKLAPALERESLVRAVADQCMTEAELPGDVRIALDELPEPIPRLGVGGRRGVPLEHGPDERA
jgi:hypothetical protein